ncbi:ERCC5/XPG/Rad2 nucleotide excision repair [Guillardia theta CCMP2712]|uniref:ERCC5/XPG/Rad2 nucleotide excision repair n=1 Tax=Guillardia theta (strain CCMP2712) TaxID=905079 RepID=L1IPP7_GUITC|nr:ERCC5/XPG/Rad2 nucleotide excision repair [Guillardia theta CCMP2712]EKX38233.1 ERCC5/XPG/Rad2 nucleotide excision repair [Guillardia theta CCMP2712]|eukprot:XP_005825213.1 ERCC5/XPG/Rad2 nucleotide excision repair [Guillardia theta CCMP2712]
MGVHGLWELLGVTGRKVEVQALGSRRVAVDASIWIIQFIKAMRQSDGSMQQNAHLLGMFRRICKLLFMKVKPVIVFDGVAPAIKRKTLQARKRVRQRGENQLRKMAEKILLNRLRSEV